MTPVGRVRYRFRMSENQSQLESTAPRRGVITATGECPVPPAGRKWIARLGVAGFVFFLVKGLLWLIVPAAIVWLGL